MTRVQVFLPTFGAWNVGNLEIGPPMILVKFLLLNSRILSSHIQSSRTFITQRNELQCLDRSNKVLEPCV